MKRNNILTVLVVVLSLVTLASCGRFQAKMEIKEANDLYKGRKYEEAIAKYESALRKAPDIDEIYLNLGLTYMAMYVPGSTHEKDIKYADSAVAAFREYLKRRPEDPKASEYLITMYLNADRKDDAIIYFEEYLKRTPTDTAIMQKLAFLYAQTGKFDQALKWYKTRAAVEPNNAEAFYIIGVICWEKSYKFADVTPEQREELIRTGMEYLDKAIKINPDYADAFLYMNLLYREKAKMISPDPNAFPVPEEKIDEYNALLQKAKELLERAMEIRKKGAPS